MLVLSRKLNESIHIGDNIVVTIRKIGRDRVSLGISAPPEIKISREEILSRLSSEPAAPATPRA